MWINGTFAVDTVEVGETRGACAVTRETLGAEPILARATNCTRGTRPAVIARLNRSLIVYVEISRRIMNPRMEA